MCRPGDSSRAGRYYCPECWFKLFTKVYDNDKIKDRKLRVEAQTKVLQGRLIVEFYKDQFVKAVDEEEAKELAENRLRRRTSLMNSLGFQ